MAWRLAMWPTRRLPASVTATIEGVVLYPPRFGMTTGVPFSTIATHEFVVPRSIPMTFSIRGVSLPEPEAYTECDANGWPFDAHRRSVPYRCLGSRCLMKAPLRL